MVEGEEKEEVRGKEGGPEGGRGEEKRASGGFAVVAELDGEG